MVCRVLTLLYMRGRARSGKGSGRAKKGGAGGKYTWEGAGGALLAGDDLEVRALRHAARPRWPIKAWLLLYDPLHYLCEHACLSASKAAFFTLTMTLTCADMPA